MRMRSRNSLERNDYDKNHRDCFSLLYFSFFYLFVFSRVTPSISQISPGHSMNVPSKKLGPGEVYAIVRLADILEVYEPDFTEERWVGLDTVDAPATGTRQGVKRKLTASSAHGPTVSSG